MILSINPTYYCNFRCSFCYLTEQQLADRNKLDLSILSDRIDQVQQYYSIDMIDLYGGEIGLLSETYVHQLCELLQIKGINDINIITNLSMINSVIQNPDLYVTVSYDFDCREQHERVWNNMFLLNKPFSILILAGPDVIKKDPAEMIAQLNMLSNLSSVEIKPYSTNQANSHTVTHRQFEQFVQQWLESSIRKNFQFINKDNIELSLSGQRNAFSNDHIYITPTGQLAVLEFDLNDREYFKELSTVQEYIQWAEQEPDKNISNICKKCKYYSKCLTEHYRYVRDLDTGCNGYKGLLDWYETIQ